MDDTIIRKIKKVVAGNFDKSFDRYRAFEEKYRFFADLTLRLAAAAEIKKGATILDIGCGNGASAEVLQNNFKGRVVGIDLSGQMIADGRKSIRNPDIRLEVGDAVNPQAVVGKQRFDAALYNASIFIIPDAKESLKAAATCLKPEGVLGFSFYPQILSAEGEDLFPTAYERCARKQPKTWVITSYEKALDGLHEVCGRVTESVWERPFNLDFLSDFFSIPAQSNSLFPRLDYSERRQLVPELFSTLAPEAPSAKIVWRLAVGTN